MEQYQYDPVLDEFELKIKFTRSGWHAFLDGTEMRNLAQIKLDLADNRIRDADDVQLVFNFGSLICPNSEKVI